MIKAYIKRLRQLGQKSKDIKKLTDQAVFIIFEKHKDELTTSNQQALDKGMDASGNDLGRYKSKAYVKKYKGGRFHPINLKKEGDFRKSIQIDFKKTTPKFKATDYKAKFLKKRYGEDIIGISDEALKAFIMRYQKDIQREFNRLFLV